MPLWKVLLEDLRFVLLYVFGFFKNGLKTQTVLFFPEFPTKRSEMYKLVKSLGYNITNNPKFTRQVEIYWKNDTFRKPWNELGVFQSKPINGNCTDISKVFVDQKHLEVFGYQTQVDPLTHQGKFVQKGDLNALHDGKILTEPISQKEEGYIYQILIDNSSDGYVNDYRTPYYFGEIPYVVVRSRKIEERFGGHSQKSKMYKTEDVFTADEIAKVKAIAKAVGLNCGDLDVLRDNASKKIYVVDINPTPWPPKGLPNEDRKRLFEELRTLFIRYSLD